LRYIRHVQRSQVSPPKPKTGPGRKTQALLSPIEATAAAMREHLDDENMQSNM